MEQSVYEFYKIGFDVLIYIKVLFIKYNFNLDTWKWEYNTILFAKYILGKMTNLINACHYALENVSIENYIYIKIWFAMNENFNQERMVMNFICLCNCVSLVTIGHNTT